MVVTVPVLGKVTQVSFERTLGTVIGTSQQTHTQRQHTSTGGVLGFATYEMGERMWNSATDGWVLSLLSASFAYGCVMASNYFKLDVSAKLSAITFLLVTFGGDDSENGMHDLASSTAVHVFNRRTCDGRGAHVWHLDGRVAEPAAEHHHMAPQRLCAGNLG